MEEYWTTFIGENGYDFEKEKANKEFEVGKKYRITSGSMGQSHTSIKIEGKEGSWNSVLFDVDIYTCPLIASSYVNE